MELKIGETKTVKLPFVLRAQDFYCEGNGLRLERNNKGFINLYANDGSRRKRFCNIPMGYAKDLKGVSYTVKAQSKSRLLFSVGNIRFVIDFAAKKVATNLIGFSIYGSKEWGDQVQMPWRGDFQPLFGLPAPAMEMDQKTAELFWQWYIVNEPSIVDIASKSRKDAKNVMRHVELWLYPVFPYVKNNKLKFEIACNEKSRVFTFFCGDDEQLRKDAELFGQMMPDILKKDWEFVVEE